MRLGPHIIHHRGLVLAGGVAKSASGLGGRAVLIGSLSSPPPHCLQPSLPPYSERMGYQERGQEAGDGQGRKGASSGLRWRWSRGP